MKYRLYLFFFLGCFAKETNAQVGFLNSTYTWTEVHYYMIGSQCFKYTMSAEPTIFNDKTYFEMLYTLIPDEEPWRSF